MCGFVLLDFPPLLFFYSRYAQEIVPKTQAFLFQYVFLWTENLSTKERGKKTNFTCRPVCMFLHSKASSQKYDTRPCLSFTDSACEKTSIVFESKAKNETHILHVAMIKERAGAICPLERVCKRVRKEEGRQAYDNGSPCLCGLMNLLLVLVLPFD